MNEQMGKRDDFAPEVLTAVISYSIWSRIEELRMGFPIEHQQVVAAMKYLADRMEYEEGYIVFSECC